MSRLIDVMFERGIFEKRFAGIIEIYPHKAMNSDLFYAALKEISKTHQVIKITNNWLRAFEKGV
jgi:hypothetical protein